ncbi:hypothetical protein FQR65_LT03252 [Abscondita terminalis]|nr:hypothetical protein FQR65_LT03252 [Abscondita terminalis]
MSLLKELRHQNIVVLQDVIMEEAKKLADFGLGRAFGVPVTSLPDYKSTFPNWTTYNLESQVSNLSDSGFDLLQQMVVYDPSKRISAKKIVSHPYFLDLDESVKPCN